MITFDASLSGGGATYQDDQHQCISNFVVASWTEEDHKRLHAVRGLPEHQAEWEAFMLLLAVRTWQSKIDGHSGKLLFRGDAKGVLQGILAGKARSARINLIIAEISLELAHPDHLLVAEHLWSEKNATCDALSRAGEGAATPEEVKYAIEDEVTRQPFLLLGPNSYGSL